MSEEQDRIVKGFAELIARLDSGVDAEAAAKQKAEANAAAMEREQRRVRAEYRELGLAPPSSLALSITARRELGLPLPEAYQREDVA